MEKIKIIVSVKKFTNFSNLLLAQLGQINWLEATGCMFDHLSPEHREQFHVAILEAVSYEEILRVCEFNRKHDINTIYLISLTDGLMVGPTHFPGKTSGADSAVLFFNQRKLGRMPTAEELRALTMPLISKETADTCLDTLYAVFSEVFSELKNLRNAQHGKKFRFIDKIKIFQLSGNAGERVEQQYVFPLFENESAERHTGADGLHCSLLLNKFQTTNAYIGNQFYLGNDRSSTNDVYNNVAIVGGGTAGYLAALRLKKAFPKLPVTLIESSKIPVIGVGEATTPDIRKFLFETLGFPSVEFYQEVKPTWKLGIKFFWGLPGDHFFNYPFGKSDIRTSYLVNDDINSSSLNSLLMSNDSSFVISLNDENGSPNYSSLSNDIIYALHLDNVSFIHYLKKKAKEFGVLYVDDKIIGAEIDPSNNEIKTIHGESGKKYEYDFLVDCSGFYSLLLEKHLQSPFVSYDNSLFTNTAVTGCIPNANKVRPYTYAETMNHGWAWNIPMRGEDHRGYVYSSAHCSEDEAIAEFIRKNPTLTNIGRVKFRSGRHQEICIGNVFAIGNSFAFVEPLESTGIHMIIREVETLTNNFLNIKKSNSVRTAINKSMNDHWDYLKGFLAIHYKFNRKFDTPFWKDCRQDADVSSIQWLLELYHDVGLLSYVDPALTRIITKEIKDELFGLRGFDTILMGQGVLPKNFEKSLQNSKIWNANLDLWKSLQSLTVPLEKDLAILVSNPELI